MAVPPFIICGGIRAPQAKALNGIYEYNGVVEGRPCYRQSGISGGNHVWFTEEALEGPMWVVTPKEKGTGGAPDSVIARSPHLARWPWEVEDWTVCGREKTFIPSPLMRFILWNPTAELLVMLPAVDGGTVATKYRCAGTVNGRPAFRSIDDCELPDDETGSFKLFWMPKAARWMLGLVTEGGGVQHLITRSTPDDGSTWASLWPWEVPAHSWEMPTATTKGVEDGETHWFLEKSISVQLASPPVAIRCDDEIGSGLQGLYEPRGMMNGRVYFIQTLDDRQLADFMGPKCLWFAEDRGQWVVTPPNRLGNSSVVLARIISRAWWPWEAHLGGSTSPETLGSAPFATLPPWQGGTTVLAATRPDWEIADPTGAFHKTSNTLVELDPTVRCASIRGAKGAKHPFVGIYVRAGLVSARPFFLQTQDDSKSKKRSNKSPQRKPKEGGSKSRAWAWHPPTVPRFALWYSEEAEQWVITEDFRLLDTMTVDARLQDSAWVPWEAVAGWEVADGVGGFVLDSKLRVARV